MERALVVVEASEAAKKLVREAGELAAGVDAELLLVHVTTEEEYERRLETMESIPDRPVSYGIDTVREGAKQFAHDIAVEELEGVDVDYDVVGAIGDRVDRILDLADRQDCDHLFMAGRERSPAGKAFFGDDTQQVILNFDGAVTVITA